MRGADGDSVLNPTSPWPCAHRPPGLHSERWGTCCFPLRMLFSQQSFFCSFAALSVLLALKLTNARREVRARASVACAAWLSRGGMGDPLSSGNERLAEDRAKLVRPAKMFVAMSRRSPARRGRGYEGKGASAGDMKRCCTLAPSRQWAKSHA